MFTVGGFARAAGVSAKALRAYDELGLFRPAWVDPVSRYRYYLPSQLPELRRILALRDLGLGLTEIRELAAGGDLRAALERRRLELERERDAIDRRLAALDIRVSEGEAADVVVRTIPRELVATSDLHQRGDGDIAAAFYELESIVRDARARAHRPPGSIPDEGRIWVPLRRSIPASGHIAVMRFAETRAATLLHRGDYDTLAEARTALERWVRVSGDRPAGPLRVLYLQFGAEPELAVPRGWVVQEATRFVTELQLPVASG